jgi:hypothetical protein
MLPFAGGRAGGLAVVQVGLSADSKTATNWEGMCASGRQPTGRPSP